MSLNVRFLGTSNVHVVLQCNSVYCPSLALSTSSLIRHEAVLSPQTKRAWSLYLVRKELAAVLTLHQFLTGYLSIHILGLSVGMIILPPKPSYFPKQALAADGGKHKNCSHLDLRAPRQPAKIIAELFSYSIVWWSLLAFVRIKLDVSRRMVCWLESSIMWREV